MAMTPYEMLCCSSESRLTSGAARPISPRRRIGARASPIAPAKKKKAGKLSAEESASTQKKIESLKKALATYTDGPLEGLAAITETQVGS